MTDLCIIGVGIHPFGRTEGMTGLDMGAAAARTALADAGLQWHQMQFAFGGSHESGNADTMISKLGPTGIPFLNISNGCATGGSSLYSASNAIAAGEFDLGLVVGFDKHPRGMFGLMPADWNMPEWYGQVGLMVTTQFFGMKMKRYMALHGISQRTLGRVAEKAFQNAVLTPHAWRDTLVDLDTIVDAPMLADPFTKYMLCSPAEGAVALVVASEARARQLGVKAIRLRSIAVRSRPEGSFEVFAPVINPIAGCGATQLAAKAAFEAAGIGPGDLDLVQLQDTEVGAEIMHMAEIGLCADGEQEQWLAEGRTRIGGALPINTDGGCIGCGEPVGASGLRQVYENVTQLRGTAGKRQVPGSPKTAMTHVYGAPGVSAATILTV